MHGHLDVQFVSPFRKEVAVYNSVRVCLCVCVWKITGILKNILFS